METPEVDPNFEPQTRARSYTWPHRPQEIVNESQTSPASEPDASTTDIQQKDDIGSAKKTSSRRNAWGNLSYADLITKAIEGSPDKRLTLSQIYDWMVQNVPYFKDKGDSTSSAGWKNSIRHNLSLHSRFMRIQNEGTGKSSWWVINPDAKLGKTPRRRACSMETKIAEKKRGRIKKRVDQIRAAMENSQSTSGDDYLDGSPIHNFQLSPEIRPRTTSNASSCGRLSPIQAGIEPDMHDSQVPPMSPIPWASETENLNYNEVDGNYTDQLVDTLVDGMKLAESNSMPLSGSDELDILGNSFLQSSGTSNSTIPQFRQNNFNQNSFSSQLEMATLRAPPPYPDQMGCSSNDQTDMDIMCGDYYSDLQTPSTNSELFDQSQQLFPNSSDPVTAFQSFGSGSSQQQGSFLAQLQNVRIKSEDKLSSRIPSNPTTEVLLSNLERQQADSASCISNGIHQHQTNSAASQQQNIYSSDRKSNISNSVTLKDLLKSKDDSTAGAATEALLALIDNADNNRLKQQQQPSQQQHHSSPARSQVMNNQLNTSFDNNKGFLLSQSSSPKGDRRQISPTPQISPQQHQVLTPQQKQGLLQQQMTDNSILRAALTQKPPAYPAASTSQTQNVYNQFNISPPTNQCLSHLLTNSNANETTSSTLQNLRLQQQRAALTEQLISLSQQNRLGNQMPSSASVPQANLQPVQNYPVRNNGNTAQSDFDVDVDSSMMDDIECDVDQVIKHELSLDGILDFNFDSVSSSTGTSSAQSIR